MFDESSIIEENYDGEDGEYVGGVEDYDQSEITEVNFSGGGIGGGGQENTSSGRWGGLVVNCLCVGACQVLYFVFSVIWALVIIASNMFLFKCTYDVLANH